MGEEIRCSVFRARNSLCENSLPTVSQQDLNECSVMGCHTWAVKWKYTLILNLKHKPWFRWFPGITALACFDILGETKFWIGHVCSPLVFHGTPPIFVTVVFNFCTVILWNCWSVQLPGHPFPARGSKIVPYLASGINLETRMLLCPYEHRLPIERKFYNLYFGMDQETSVPCSLFQKQRGLFTLGIIFQVR